MGLGKTQFLGWKMNADGKYSRKLMYGTGIALAVGFLGAVITGIVSAEKIAHEGFVSLYGL